MEASYVGGAEAESILDPGGSAWKRARAERIALMGTPVGLQPTEAIRSKWFGQKIGAIGAVSVAALHDGSRLAFRLEWDDPTESRSLDDTTAFPDAAAVALPSTDDSPLMTMGAPGAAVNAWYWRADEEGLGRDVVAEGLGSSRPVEPQRVRAQGVWKGGRWGVVISRELTIPSDAPVAQLSAGQRTSFGVAVWEGSSGERAGIKAFSGDWLPLTIQPLPTAKR